MPPPHAANVLAARAMSSSFVPTTSRLCASCATVDAIALCLMPKPLVNSEPNVPVMALEHERLERVLLEVEFQSDADHRQVDVHLVRAHLPGDDLDRAHAHALAIARALGDGHGERLRRQLAAQMHGMRHPLRELERQHLEQGASVLGHHVAFDEGAR